MALIAAWAKFPVKQSKPKQSWIERQKFSKDFDYPNNQLDYSIDD